MFIAHIRGSDHAIQVVQDHLEGVAWLARKYGEPVALAEHAELAGFLHDMGKYTEAFTTYIRNAVLYDEVAGSKIDHSTAGAKYLYDNYYGKDIFQDLAIETVGMAILSHHSGLQNFIQIDTSQSDYIRRVTNDDLPHYREVVANFEAVPGNVNKVKLLLEGAKKEVQEFMKRVEHFNGRERTIHLNYMQKLVFSCLIDADRTDTCCFEEATEVTVSDYASVFEEGYNSLIDQVREWEETAQPINMLRNEMSESCDRMADDPSSIMTLSIPTGGGKTFASLRYALKHALKHKKERIIYVVPYTTILEQNAAAVRDIMKQPEVVLEHHANVIDDSDLDDEPDYYQQANHKKLQLGRDNWDYPIIFTTMVQFLDAFFQKGTRKGRRLHHLTNSVIIVDEVQSVPYKHFPLFNTAMNFLNLIGKSSVLLCTATQPVVGEMDYKIHLEENAEIVPDLVKTVDAFKRVSIINKVEKGGWNLEKIASFTEEVMAEHESLLIILNTKSGVRKLYQLLEELNLAEVYHLSTSMCPAHRTEKLAMIRQKLGKERIICVSTQLIEAGVDISFESVIRSQAGLDSIAQAAGRCNRNGEREEGNVYIIRSAEESLSKLPEIRIGGEVLDNYILKDERFAENYLSPQAIETYFRHFDAMAGREIKVVPPPLDRPLISHLNGCHPNTGKGVTISKGMFKTVERYFEAIESPTTSVIVPYGEGKEIIALLNQDLDMKEFNHTMKRSQQYAVNLFDHDLQRLSQDNLLAPLYDDSLYCLTEQAYDENFGVTFAGEAGMTDYNF